MMIQSNCYDGCSNSSKRLMKFADSIPLFGCDKALRNFQADAIEDANKAVVSASREGDPKDDMWIQGFGDAFVRYSERLTDIANRLRGNSDGS